MSPQSLKTGNLRAPHSERGVDCYETPDVAVEALRRVEFIPKRVWEPACGSGHIVKVLRSYGHHVLASDIANHGCLGSSVLDFLTAPLPAYGAEAIVTNPPFMLAHEFVRHALEIGVPKIIMLLRLAFMESEKRRDILDGGKLARVHVFRLRLPMMHRAGWEGRKANSGMAFAWFVFEQHHKGLATIDRISWEREDD